MRLTLLLLLIPVLIFGQNARQITVRDTNNISKIMFATEDNEGLTSLITTSKPFELAVAMGQVPGYSTLDKFGVNLNITTATDPEDVWEFGGLYNYDDTGAAPIKYLSSSSALDTQTVTVTGLNVNGYEVTQNIKLNGQNNITLTDSLWRVYRMSNISSTNLQGVVYCHIDPSPTDGIPLDANVRAIIDDGNNQTLMTLYTVPRGKVAFLYRGEAGLHYQASTPADATNYTNIHYKSRRYGMAFTVKKSVTVLSKASSIFQDVRSFPDVIPGLTDIKIEVTEVTEDMGLWATFDLLIVDEDKFSEEFLNAIGQP